MFVEKSGLGPADSARVTVDTSGAVESSPEARRWARGSRPPWRRFAPTALGVDYKAMKVIHGRTDLIAHGIGAHSSRASVMTGSATHIAATKVREKALRIASERMQTPAADLDIIAGNVVRKGAPEGSPSMSLADIAGAVAPTSRTRGDHEPGLSAEGWFFTDHMVFPYGIHIAVIRVDRGTGEVAIERFLVAYDVGRAINPMMIEGQITGGVAQGIGGALYEEFRYDEHGQPFAVTLADYLMLLSQGDAVRRDTDQRGRAKSAQSPGHQRGRRGGHKRGRRRDSGCNRSGDLRAGSDCPAAGNPATHA